MKLSYRGKFWLFIGLPFVALFYYLIYILLSYIFN